MTGENLNARLADAEGRLAALIRSGKADREVAEALFLASLGRRPDDSQWETVRSALVGADDRAAVFRDLAWALVNSKEFLFNH